MVIKEWVARHARLTAWAVLAVGMVAILIWSARNVGLEALQWAALIVATILIVLGFMTILIGLLGDLIARNRRLNEEINYRLKKRDA